MTRYSASTGSREADTLRGTYSIGDFARLSGVTPKALRHYDRIGVLRPALVDDRNRYRRYSADQLAELYELLSLSRMGLSLRQARAAIARAGDNTAARALLVAKREIESRIAEDTARLAWIGAKLDELAADVDAASDSSASSPAVVLKEQPPLRVRAVRDRLATYDDADTLLDDLTAGATPEFGLSCLLGTVWHDCGTETGIIDCEAVALEPGGRRRPGARGARGRAGDLPGATLACVIHRGGDEDIPSTYAATRRWIAARGFTVVGPNREWYLGRARGEPVMEIQFPVAPARRRRR